MPSLQANNTGFYNQINFIVYFAGAYRINAFVAVIFIPDEDRIVYPLFY
jgi:hypothetical protein